MDEDGTHRRRAGRAPRGALPDRPEADQPRWRRAVQWLLGAHEDVDQEGLLAERTLGVVQARRPPPDEDDGEDPRAGPPR
jgi:hypothetical protein